MKDGIERYIQKRGSGEGALDDDGDDGDGDAVSTEYDAGEVPAARAHGGGANAIAWRVDPAALDARCTYRYSSTVCERRRIRIACWR